MGDGRCVGAEVGEEVWDKIGASVGDSVGVNVGGGNLRGNRGLLVIVGTTVGVNVIVGFGIVGVLNIVDCGADVGMFG